jgi:hypothetical protein
MSWMRRTVSPKLLLTGKNLQGPLPTPIIRMLPVSGNKVNQPFPVYHFCMVLPACNLNSKLI